MVHWRLKKGADRRFRSGHPWVYSNELQESPKGITPGEPIELQDAGGVFLARGYGNPSSLISFRSMTREPSDLEPLSELGIERRLRSALDLRLALGLKDTSFRWVFAEADELPGLIIDRYLLLSESGDPIGQAIAFQAHTAGIDRVEASLLKAIEKIIRSGSLGITWEQTAVVARNDLGIRELEGIPVGSVRVVKELKGTSLNPALISVGKERFFADLIEGQKTGFFLDQAENARRFSQLWKPTTTAAQTLRILDLCCYVGQWSTHWAHALLDQGHAVEVTLVDASATALEWAQKNVSRLSSKPGKLTVKTMKGDVLKDLGDLPTQSFDVVIADPPALIKGRKAIPAGTHAYLQLNTQVFRVIKLGGAVVTASCSALLEEEAFDHAIQKAAQRNQRSVKWIARGTQGPDHPVGLGFPEGRYLKAWLGIVSN